MQERIVGILSTYDDRIENNAPRSKIFEQMARMLYEEWFVSFRFPGHDRVEMIDSAIVGLIPKAVPIVPLSLRDCPYRKCHPAGTSLKSATFKKMKVRRWFTPS